jgi:surface protein
LTSTAYWFYGLQNLSSITGIGNLNTGNVRDMDCMFYNCSGLTSLDVTGFKTDNVWSIYCMFCGCSGLTSLDVTGFKTDKVTHMSGLFQGCSGLTSLDLSKFNTDNTTSLERMFYGCSGLTTLDLSNFNTANVTSMNSMFWDCSSLMNLDVSGFKTDKVTHMGNMFRGCSKLTSLNLSNFNTANVLYMSSMFDDCSGLTSLNLSNFNTANVTSMESMFRHCSGLTTLDLSNFNTANVTRMGYMFDMFNVSNSLTSLDLSGFNTENVESMDYMFRGCSGLKTVYASDGWSTAKIQNGVSMFTGCISLVGGAGTTYNANHADHTYAHIDGGASKPGYFTDKNATPVEEGVDEITIKEIGKTTYCSKYDLDFTNVAGIKAYIAMGYDDNDKTIWLARVMKVPAGTGLLVKGDAGTYKIPHVNVRAYYTNMLVGNLGETIKIEETDGDKTNYYLSGKDGTFVSVNGSANIGKNKAYLQLPTSIFAGTRSIGVSFDDEDGTTAIRETKQSREDGAYYTLQGQRVVNPGKGLYIKNGKKVVIK